MISMELKKYLGVDAKDITLIDYVFIDQAGDTVTYSKPCSIAIGGDSSVKIFEKNGVIKEYQKIFMVCNTISMVIQSIKNSDKMITTNKSRFNVFKAKEFLTDIPINLTVNVCGDIFGQMASEKASFDVRNCYICEKSDVLSFFVNLRNDQMFDKYLKSIAEIMHLSIKSYFDSNNDKIKKCKIKNS